MDRYVTHASFTLERSYPVPPGRVFAAWADPALKSRWFAGGDACPNHELDFRWAAARWPPAAPRAAR